MRASCADLLVAVSLLGCARAHEPCPAPPPEPEAPCASFAPGEGAPTPPGGPQVFPERAEARDAEALATFLVLLPDGRAERITYRLGLRQGSVVIFGTEPLDPAWARERARALSGACAALPGGGELRLLPSRPDPAPGGGGREVFGARIHGALIAVRDAGVSRHDIWVPDWNDRFRRACSRALVLADSEEAILFRGLYTADVGCPELCVPGFYVVGEMDNVLLCELAP